MADVNLANMSDEEIGALGLRCLDSLSLAERVQVVLKAFHSDDERGELIEWLQDAKTDEEEAEDDL